MGNKGRRAGCPLLLECDGALFARKDRELQFGPTERKATGARMYHPELIRHPESCPALVLNADYTPLSYYPLSLWPWQTAVKAMFLERVDVVAALRSRGAQSEHRDEAAVGDRAARICAAQRISGLHPVQPVPARPLQLRHIAAIARAS